ncbi:lmo0937 family membrane protein [Arachidicoccus sp.]|uniref:lmo0937 family membrane protein n=1 Tax=Arachidicoccus sp. TaxID=1872624 RepID=UPI003D240CE5
MGNHSTFLTKKSIMAIFLYIMALLLIISWIIGFFLLAAGPTIHLLILFAILAILLNIFKYRDSPPL